MHRPFESAATYVERVSDSYIVDGQLLLPEIDPTELVFRLRLGVYWQPDEVKGQADWRSGHMVCHEGAAVFLLENCQRSFAAFDLISYVCADYIYRDAKLTPSLQMFAAQRLIGQISEPEKTRPRAYKTALRSMFLYIWAKTAAQDYGLELSRGKEKKGDKMSGCDAVIEGLSRNGHHLGYDAMLSICHGKTNDKLRKMISEVETAANFARSAGIIPQYILDRMWSHV